MLSLGINMSDHLNEMRFFLEVVHAYSDSCNETAQILTEDTVSSNQTKIKEEAKESLNEELLNDLVSLKDRFLSITSNEGDSRIDEGFELGMYKAVEMLENLLVTKYNRRI